MIVGDRQEELETLQWKVILNPIQAWVIQCVVDAFFFTNKPKVEYDYYRTPK